MITPIRVLNIREVCGRMNDLLVSADDIKKLAKKEREKAISEFVERLCTVCCGESTGVIFGNRVKADMLTVDGVCEIAYEIAEAMKGE